MRDYILTWNHYVVGRIIYDETPRIGDTIELFLDYERPTDEYPRTVLFEVEKVIHHGNNIEITHKGVAISSVPPEKNREIILEVSPIFYPWDETAKKYVERVVAHTKPKEEQ